MKDNQASSLEIKKHLQLHELLHKHNIEQVNPGHSSNKGIDSVFSYLNIGMAAGANYYYGLNAMVLAYISLIDDTQRFSTEAKTDFRGFMETYIYKYLNLLNLELDVKFPPYEECKQTYRDLKSLHNTFLHNTLENTSQDMISLTNRLMGKLIKHLYKIDHPCDCLDMVITENLLKLLNDLGAPVTRALSDWKACSLFPARREASVKNDAKYTSGIGIPQPQKMVR